MRVQSILVLGAGKVGSTIADLLVETLGVSVTLADKSHDLRGTKGEDRSVQRVQIDVEDDARLASLIAAHPVVINALPFFLATRVARAAFQAGVHYFDLTEDVAATHAIREFAPEARAVLMPQCGLAPGVIGMLGAHLARCFEELVDLRLRVGALSRNPTNDLRYNFTWSIDGVINEYCNPCEAIVNGKPTTVQPLEGYETFTLDGDNFEAFNTSGGLGTLCETLSGRVQNLDYKTIRYPGHREGMRFLLHDMRLITRRDLLREILEHAVPHTRQDVVILFASASGRRNGRFEQETRWARIYGSTLRGTERTAIELTTAAGVCGVVEMLLADRLPAKGFVSQEQVDLEVFLATKPGAYYSALARQS